MPAKLRGLYKAKSISELKTLAKTSIQSRDPKKLCKSADTLFSKALDHQSRGDEEMAYVYYMRYMEIIMFIHQCKEYKRDKDYYSKMLGVTKPSEAMGILETIDKSLTKRYDMLQESELLAEKQVLLIEEKPEIQLGKNSEIEPHSNAIESKVNDSKSKQSLSSTELYCLIEDQTSLLIIDVRSVNDFSESHLNHSSCINIPSEILAPGLTAAAIEKSLPKESVAGWNKRSLMDFVILLDWKSTFESMTKGSPIHCLMEAICKWDQTTVLRSSPFVLVGGYDDWLLRYPALNTNPDLASVKRPCLEVRNTLANELILDFDYPELDDIITNSTPAENGPMLDANVTNNVDEPILPKPTIDRTKKPVINNSQSNQKYISQLSDPTPPVNESKPSSIESVFPKNLESTNGVAKPPPKLPIVDRSKKPLREEETSLAERSLEMATERLAQERKFESLCLQREQEAERGMREELLKQEEELRTKIDSLEREQLASEERLQQVREENESMKKEIANFQKVKEEEQVHQQKIRAMEDKKKEMDLEVERLRQIRKKKEQKIVENEKPVVPEPVVMPPPPPPAPPGGTYTIRLSDAPGKRGLSRSHSSPDIARLLEEEENQPQVDRKMKPSSALEPNRHLKPLIDSSSARLRNLSPIYSSQGRAETGLRNLGNTCFMNSVIQCLYSTVPLTCYLLEEYKRHINRENKLGTGGEIADELAVVIQHLYRGLYRSIAPSDFKATVGKYLPVCVGYEQQDAHEFLVVLMDKLHGDLNRATCTQKSNVPTTDKAFWQWHVNQNKSIVTELFEGLLKSTLRCISCNTESSNYEVFSSFSLPLPSSSRCSLKSCIQKFLETERMCGEAAWDCPNCKQKREAEKYMSICRLPLVLIIHLKRFSYEGMWRRKLQTSIDFPLNDLDMAPHLGLQSNANTKYSLYGIVNHYGTLEGGHYIAYCKSQPAEKWYRYDDHDVAELSSSRVQTSAAYLLFYTSITFS